MTRRLSALLALTLLPLSACGGGQTDASSGGGDKMGVIVGFYPLEYAARRIGGERVEVTNLTRPGAEPHDVELTPQDVAKVAKADVAVYEKAIQPAVAEAVTSQEVKHSLDVGEAAKLDKTVDQPIIDVSSPEETGHDHEHAATTPSAGETGHNEEHEHAAEAGSVDPHFWLDPVRYGQVADAVAATLSEADPAGKAVYDKNLQALKADLKSLDADYSTALKSCTNTTLVTGHAAFGYLAARYGFTQAAISGLSPEQEPDPKRLAQVADYAKKHGVKTIYAETLASPAVAETVARETGATTAVLDPIEGVTKQGSDYLSIMRDNLTTLKSGQGCE